MISSQQFWKDIRPSFCCSFGAFGDTSRLDLTSWPGLRARDLPPAHAFDSEASCRAVGDVRI